MGRSFAIEPQGDIEGPVQMLEVYYESACALERLVPDEQYKVIGALCIMAGLALPPKRPTPKEGDGQ